MSIAKHESRKTENRNRKQVGECRKGLLLLPFIGGLFLLWYVLHATVDVVYSDYIRIINSYLPDTLDPTTFFVPDILTRIPINYPLRWINVTFFGYSVLFDRVFCILGCVLLMCSVAQYLIRERSSVWIILPVMLVGFSLDKWEMLINGTGCVHFLSYGLFFYHYLVLERVFTGTQKPGDVRRLCVLPWLALLVAGPYIAQYTATLLVAYGYLAFLRNRNVDGRRLPWYGLCALVPLMLYYMSNAAATFEHTGAQDIGLLETLQQYRGFSLHFLLNGFASTLLSGAVLEDLLAAGTLTYPMVYLLGALVILLYASAVLLYFRTGQYRRTIFPMLLLVSGAGSHVLVFLSRYIFLTETYAWQSRYGLQYLPGTLGLLLIYGAAFSHFRKQYLSVHTKQGDAVRISGEASPVNRGRAQKVQTSSGQRHALGALLGMGLSLVVLLSFTAGSCYTDKREIDAMPFRQMYFASMADAARDYENLSDDELNLIFEYHHGPNRVRHAMDILKDNQWNVFRE